MRSLRARRDVGTSHPAPTIFARVDDETTLRTDGSKADPYSKADLYHVFRTMLDAGDRPDDRVALLKAASAEPATERPRRAKRL